MLKIEDVVLQELKRKNRNFLIIKTDFASC
jgi:hypothetical protein